MRDRLLAVERLEYVRVVRAEEVRTEGSAGIAALGTVLDLDHVGTEVRQVAGGVWTGRPVFGCDDPQALKR